MPVTAARGAQPYLPYLRQPLVWSHIVQLQLRAARQMPRRDHPEPDLHLAKPDEHRQRRGRWGLALAPRAPPVGSVQARVHHVLDLRA